MAFGSEVRGDGLGLVVSVRTSEVDVLEDLKGYSVKNKQPLPPPMCLFFVVALSGHPVE